MASVMKELIKSRANVMSMRNFTAQKNEVFVKDFFSKCEQFRSLFTFTKETLNGKLHFLCSACLAMAALAIEISCKFTNYQGVKYINQL